MWARISSSGSFSSAERLISSISRRCSRTLASSSLSVCSGLAAAAAATAASGGGGGAVQDTPCSASVGASGRAGAGSGAGARRAVKRPIMASSLDDPQRFSTARPRQLEPASTFLVGGGLGFRLRENELLQRERDLV